MTKLKSAAFLMLVVLFTACGPTIYKADNFQETRDAVKKIAILPFSTQIDAKRLPKGVTVETLRESEKNTGYGVQSNAYSWLLKRQSKYTTTFLDVDKTNAILKKANISYEDLATYDKGELCTLLGVDAVLSGKITMSKPMSEGAAIAIGLLAGAWGPTNRTTAALTIHDAKAELLWKYDFETSGSVGSSAERLSKGLMNNASKKFPYKK